MGVDVRAVSGGKPVVWSWVGTCQRGGSNKYYLGVVVDNGDGTCDGLCAGAAIGAPPRVYPQCQGVSQAAAVAKVEKQVNTKKKEYQDDPGFLVGVNQAVTANIRAAAAAPVAQAPAGSEIELIWPMLAPNDTPQAKLDEIMQDDNRWVAEEKYDGMRLVGQMVRGGTRYTSRGSSVNDPTKPIEKTDALPHLSIEWPQEFWGSAIDGELIAEGKISSDVSGNLHAKDGRDKSDLVMVLYDLPYWKGRDVTDTGEAWPFEKRRDHLERLFEMMKASWIVDNGSMAGFPFRLCLQHTIEKEELLKNVRAAGGEGIMLKNLDAAYVQGKRPSNTIYKVKKHMEDDVIIVGFTEGKGKYAGQIGAIRFGQYVSRSICLLTGARPMKPEHVHGSLERVINDEVEDLAICELGQTSGMVDALRRDMTDNPEKYIGRVMKVKAMERLKGGTFRHPQYLELREEGDKAATECVWEG